MKALILAAGRGSRLAPLTDLKPKGLVDFRGRPLISWQLDMLREHGISDISIVSGYRGEMFSGLGCEIFRNDHWKSTNMVFSLMCAAEWLRDQEDVLVAYADIIYSSQVLSAISRFKGNVGVVVDKSWQKLWQLRYSDLTVDVESLKLGNSGEILDIGLPVSDVSAVDGQYIGMVRLSKQGISSLCELYVQAKEDARWLNGRSKSAAYMTDVIRGLAQDGVQVSSVPISGGWLEFDSVTDLEKYQSLPVQNELVSWIPSHIGSYTTAGYTFE